MIGRRCLDTDDGDYESDKDECEEWERHEALNDDVTQHERTKNVNKCFEEEMEVIVMWLELNIPVTM